MRLGVCALIPALLWARSARAEPSLRPYVLADLEPGAGVSFEADARRYSLDDDEGTFSDYALDLIARGQVSWKMLRARASIPLRLATSDTPTFGGGEHRDVALGDLDLGVAVVGEVAVGAGRLQGSLGVDVSLPTVTGLDPFTLPDVFDARDVGRYQDQTVPRVHGDVAYQVGPVRAQAELGVAFYRTPDFVPPVGLPDTLDEELAPLLYGGLSSAVLVTPRLAVVGDLTFTSQTLYPECCKEDTTLEGALDLGVRGSFGRTTVGGFVDVGLRQHPSTIGLGLEVIHQL